MNKRKIISKENFPFTTRRDYDGSILPPSPQGELQIRSVALTNNAFSYLFMRDCRHMSDQYDLFYLKSRNIDLLRVTFLSSDPSFDPRL